MPIIFSAKSGILNPELKLISNDILRATLTNKESVNQNILWRNLFPK